MTNLKKRVSDLEKKANVDGEEIIIEVVNYSADARELSEEEIEKLIAEARARGEKIIVIPVPYKPQVER